MATPTLVQHVATGYENVAGAATFTITLPNTVLSGNMVVVGFEYDSGMAISSVKDDGGNSFTAGPTANNAANALKIASYYLVNDTFSSKQVVITFSGTPGNGARILADVSEWYNVATSTPTDGSSSSSTSKSAGSITTGINGDLIWHFGVDISDNTGTTNKNPNFNGTSITAGTGFTLLAADLQAGMCAQYQVQSTAGAINPTFTTSGAATWGSLAIAFKSATSGTAPSSSAMRIVNVFHICQPAAAALPGLQFPTQGNLLVGLWTSGDVYITGASDSASNTWTTYQGLSSTQSLVSANVIFAQNATTSNGLHNFTLTYNATTAGQNMLVMYDIVNAATTSVLASGARLIGNQSVNANISTINVSPGSSNGIAFCTVAIEGHTINALTTTGGILDTVVNSFDDNGSTANSTLDEDNAYGHVYNTNTNQITFTWGYNHSKYAVPGIGNWACVAACFNPSGASGTLPVLVQGPVNATATSGTTITSTFANATKTGNTILAVVDSDNTAGTLTVSSFTVTGGAATFTKIVSQIGTAAYVDNEAWAAAGITGGTTAVQVTMSGAQNFGDLTIFEYTNMPSSWSADTTNSGAATANTALTSGTITTTNANDLIMAVFSVASTGNGVQALLDNIITTENTAVLEWETVNATQSAISFTGTQSGSFTYSWIVFALKGLPPPVAPLRVQITGTITTSATTLNVEFPYRPFFRQPGAANLILVNGSAKSSFTPVRVQINATISVVWNGIFRVPVLPQPRGTSTVVGTFATKTAQRAPINALISVTGGLVNREFIQRSMVVGTSTTSGTVNVRFSNIIRPTAIGSISTSGHAHGSVKLPDIIVVTGGVAAARPVQRAPINARAVVTGAITVRLVGTTRLTITGIITSSGVIHPHLIGQIVFPTASGTLNTSTANILNVRLVNKLEITLSTVPIVLTGTITARFQQHAPISGTLFVFGQNQGKTAIRLTPLLTGLSTLVNTTLNAGQYVYPRPAGGIGLISTMLNLREMGTSRIPITGFIGMVNTFLQVGLQPTRIQLLSKVIQIFNTVITPRYVSPSVGPPIVSVSTTGYYVVLDAAGLFTILYMVPQINYIYAAKQVLYGPYATYQLAFPQLLFAFSNLTQD